MEDLPKEKIPLEGGRGSALLGIALTSLSLLVMVILIIYPQTSNENFILSLITATCLMATGATILVLVSDYPLISSTVGIYFLLLFWRLRYLGASWILILSAVFFVLAVILHIRTPNRRFKGRSIKPGEPSPK